MVMQAGNLTAGSTFRRLQPRLATSRLPTPRRRQGRAAVNHQCRELRRVSQAKHRGLVGLQLRHPQLHQDLPLLLPDQRRVTGLLEHRRILGQARLPWESQILTP
jgi:hypothetical protein